MELSIEKGPFCPEFSAPLAAKLCVKCEYVFEVQKWCGLLYHRAKFGEVRISVAAGVESSMFLPLALRCAQRRYFGY